MSTAPITPLPRALADAIAAGEVIERPASVVKELLENSLDAGAGRVQVTVIGGGLVLAEVVDDGCGIPEDELELALAPHATSKIHAAGDLDRITSLGFRGEALASMAAVAEICIVSRPPEQDAAGLIRARPGGILERGHTGGALGTRVSVSDLFATTPTRLRFLRGERAEAAAIRRAVAELALTSPGVAVDLCLDGSAVLRSPGTGSRRDAAAAVLGARLGDGLLDVDEPGEISVTGLISGPAAHQATRGGLVLSINGRRVHSAALLAAVAEAYQGLLPVGRHPVGVLDVAVDPAAVDVNVHPAKREVRLRDERAVFAAVQRACWRTLRQSVSVPVLAPVTAPTNGVETAHATLQLEDAAVDSGPATAADLAGIAPLTVLGQAYGEWIVAAGRGAVVVIDPHAAHEKMVYEELLAEWRSGRAPQRQMLLIPAVLELDAGRFERCVEYAELLGRCGFDVEPFGPSAVRCTAVPSLVAGADPGRLVEELLDAGGPQLHRMAAVAACHAAVRFGDRLDPAEQQRLADRIPFLPGGSTCPHGRPTALILSEASLRRSFRRP